VPDLLGKAATAAVPDETGHAERTFKGAKAALGITARNNGLNDPWLWHLSDEGG
jgi:hypothetical protein